MATTNYLKRIVDAANLTRNITICGHLVMELLANVPDIRLSDLETELRKSNCVLWFTAAPFTTEQAKCHKLFLPNESASRELKYYLFMSTKPRDIALRERRQWWPDDDSNLAALDSTGFLGLISAKEQLEYINNHPDHVKLAPDGLDRLTKLAEEEK